MIRDAALTKILDTAKGAMSMATDREAELAIIAAAVAAIERHGDDGSDAMGDLSDYAIDVRGHDPDRVQAASVKGLNHELDRKAAEQTSTKKPNNSTKQTKKTRDMRLKKLADIQPESISWLWPERIARKFVMLAGMPDCGKTTVAIDIAARVTKGSPWPDGAGNAPLGSVIFLTAEDGLADTIRPRADAAGADVNRVYIIDAMTDENDEASSFDLAQDLALLARKAKEIGDVSLIVIDPITAYMGCGKVDTHKTSDVRAVLMRVKDFADEHGIAVLCISHPSKSVSKAMDAATGSQAFIAAARAAWLLARETDEEGAETGRTLMVPIKNNLSKERRNGISYRIASFDFGETTAPFVIWDTEVSISADQALAMTREPPSSNAAGDGSSLAEAVRFIEEEFLVTDRIEASDLASWARNAGISADTLKRARKQLGVEAKRDGFGPGAKYYLSLPGGRSM